MLVRRLRNSTWRSFLKSDSRLDDDLRVVGILFPVPIEYLSRILEMRKDIFVKYLPRGSSKLRAGHKIVFYASRSSKQIVGEATVSSVEFLAPDELLKKYGKRVFLTEEELVQYTQFQSSRPSTKQLFVAVLNRVKKYHTPVLCSRHMTMAGMYLSDRAYRDIVDRAGKDA